MKRLIVAAVAALWLAVPAASQTLTLGNLKAPIARAAGQAPARSIKDLWVQINSLPAAKPPVGDMQEPELGADFTKIPPIVPTNVDVSSLLTRTGPAGGRIPGTAKPDNVGAFRFICGPGQISYDDPIVYPNQPGKSHLHQWFGNTAANANSTYTSLRTTGDSTCMNILNRSAYWMPAMLDGKGKVVRPDYVSIYYKGRPKYDPECSRNGGACLELPRGLRMIFGYDMITGKKNTYAAYFDCDPKPGSATYATITEAAKVCGPGARLGAIIRSPSCWDGKRLDSPNHRDHMAYEENGHCPATHPFHVPGFTMGAWYTVDEARADTWYLSSDDMTGMGHGMMPAGSTFHADWLGAWDDQVMAIWMRECINKLLNCSTGELGDGQQLREPVPFQWKASPRLVPVPARSARP